MAFILTKALLNSLIKYLHIKSVQNVIWRTVMNLQQTDQKMFVLNAFLTRIEFPLTPKWQDF